MAGNTMPSLYALAGTKGGLRTNRQQKMRKTFQGFCAVSLEHTSRVVVGIFSHYPGSRGQGGEFFTTKRGGICLSSLRIGRPCRVTLWKGKVLTAAAEREDAASTAAATSFEGPDGIQPQPAREKQCICVSGSRWRTHPACGHRGENYLSLACFLSLSFLPGILAHQTDLLLILLWKLYTPQRLNSNLSKTERRKQTSQEAIMQNTRAIICAAVFMVPNLNRQC
jgi:hypothetical protein